MERPSIEFLVRYQDRDLLRRELESIPDVTVSVDNDSLVAAAMNAVLDRNIPMPKHCEQIASWYRDSERID